MTASNLISVVIPAYDAEATLAATLASAQAQTAAEIEIIVVDDGSRDRTAAIVQSAAADDGRIRLVSQPNAGVAAARNAGIAVARGGWIAPLDADDLWHPRKLELQLATAEAAPRRPGFVYCWSRRIDAGGRVRSDDGRARHRGNVFAQLVASNFLNSASLPLLCRDAVEKAGGFDASLQAAGAHGAEDLQLWLAIAEVEPVEVVPAFLVGYRQLPGSMSQAPLRMLRSLRLVLADLERRRPDTPAKLLRLGHMNYDLYAAALAFSGCDRVGFLRHLGAGLRRAPVAATSMLACQAAMRLARLARHGGDHPLFLDLAPEQSADTALSDCLDRQRQAAAERAARGWPAGGGAEGRTTGRPA